MLSGRSREQPDLLDGIRILLAELFRDMHINFPRHPGIPCVAKPAADLVVSKSLLEEQAGMGVPEAMSGQRFAGDVFTDLFESLIEREDGDVQIVQLLHPPVRNLREPIRRFFYFRVLQLFLFDEQIYFPDDCCQLLLDWHDSDGGVSLRVIRPVISFIVSFVYPDAAANAAALPGRR